MARLIIDKNRQDFLEQLESLRESYASFDKKKNKTPIQIAALAESEEEFVKEGLVPYLRNIIKEATEALRIPVTLKVDSQPGKPIQITAEPQKGQQTAPTPATYVPPKPAPTASAPQPIKPQPRPYYTTKTASKAPPTGLRVNIGNGNVIHEYYAADTFAQAIAYAMDKLGAQKVADTITRYGIYLDNEPLVKKGSFKSPDANSHEVGLGYYTNTHSNNPTKKRQLDKISDILGLHWTVVILEKRQ